MYYDVSTGYGSVSWGEPPQLKRIRKDQSDGSCTNLKEAKEWWLRNFNEWCDNQLTDLEGLRASDISWI